MTDLIRFQDVTRSYRGQAVLTGLSFSVRQGEIYALLGRNGAGKTTAFRILLGELLPHSGRAELLGESSENLSAKTRSRVGLVTEGHPVYPFMSIGDLVEFEAGTQSTFDRAYAVAALSRLHLPQAASLRALSRGQRSLVVLIMALATRPKVLLMDDPAMGLDAAMRREFLDAMIELLGEQGRSVLYSSHILGDVERVADRVGILHGGALVADMELDQLKRRISRRFVKTARPAAEWQASVPGLLRVQLERGGARLVLFDDGSRGEAIERALRALDPALPPADGLSLEEAFLELTAGPVVLGAASGVNP